MKESPDSKVLTPVSWDSHSLEGKTSDSNLTPLIDIHVSNTEVNDVTLFDSVVSFPI